MLGRWMILILAASCSTSVERDDGGRPDASEADASEADASEADASEADAGEVDSGDVDSGEPDGGATATTCPDRSSYLGESWPNELEIRADDELLGDAMEAAPLEAVRSKKVRAWIAPGRYPVPTASGSYQLRLPLCLDLGDRSAPRLGPIGEALVNPSSDLIYLSITQRIEVDGEQDWIVSLHAEGAPESLTIAGGELRRADNSDFRRLLSNHFPGYDGRRHTITFEGGSLVSEFRMVWGGTPSSGLIVRASGEIDGTTFDQADYWMLVNNYQHHFFGADWAMLFETPIGGACGLRVDSGDPLLLWGDPTMTTLSTIDCDLVPLEARPVSDQMTESF